MELNLVNKRFKNENMNRAIAFKEMDVKLPREIKSFLERKNTYKIGCVKFQIMRVGVVSVLYVKDFRKYGDSSEYELSLQKLLEYMVLIEEELGENIILQFVSALIPKSVEEYIKQLYLNGYDIPKEVLTRVGVIGHSNYWRGILKGEEGIKRNFEAIEYLVKPEFKKVMENYEILMKSYSEEFKATVFSGVCIFWFGNSQYVADFNGDTFFFQDDELGTITLGESMWDDVEEVKKRLEKLNKESDKLLNALKAESDSVHMVSDKNFMWKYKEYRSGCLFEGIIKSKNNSLIFTFTNGEESESFIAPTVEERVRLFRNYIEEWFQKNEVAALINPDWDFVSKFVKGLINTSFYDYGIMLNNKESKIIVEAIVNQIKIKKGILKRVEEIKIETGKIEILEDKLIVKLMEEDILIYSEYEVEGILNISEFREYLTEKKEEMIKEIEKEMNESINKWC